MAPRHFQRSQPWLYPLFLGSIVIMILFYTPRPEPAYHPLPSAWIFPQDIEVEAWPLTPGEEEWLKSGGALAGDRWRFRWREQQGSILLVTSDSWRAHHRPERCFQVYGLQVENSYTVLTEAGFPLRYLAMGTGAGENQYSAMYWFQSEHQLTDDHAARIWSDLSPDRGLWVLVTILMDQPVDPSSQEMQPFYQSVRLAVTDNLEGGVANE
jgi:exosortase O